MVAIELDRQLELIMARGDRVNRDDCEATRRLRMALTKAGIREVIGGRTAEMNKLQRPPWFTHEDAQRHLEEMERGFAEESAIRQAEGVLALRRWHFMRRHGMPLVVAHTHAVAATEG